MHFGDRQFSKNGHRTIIFKDPNVKQFRLGLSETDLRKIEIVYGPECQTRDRQEKIDLCQVYPGVARKKRDLHEHNENLRVNREIKPSIKNFTDVAHILNELGIEREVEDIIDQVYKAAAVAVENARKKYCNQTKVSRRDLTGSPELSTKGSHIVNIMDAIAKFTQSLVDVSIANLTVFCESMDAIEAYQRVVCRWGSDPRCQSYYKSTKAGAVKYSTQHRPSYYPSTKNVGNKFRYQFGLLRADDTETTKGVESNDNKNETVAKKKREAHKEVDINKAIIEEKTPKKEADEKAIEIDGETKTNSSNVSKILTDKRKRAVRRSKDGGYRVHSHKRMKYDEGLARSQERVKRKKKKHYSDDSAEQEERSRNYSSKKKKVDDDLSQSQEKRKRKKKIKDSDERGEREERIRHPKRGRHKNVKRAGPVGVPRTVQLSKKNKEFYEDRMWPGGVVRYVITEFDQYNLHDLRSRLERVNSILEKKTCVRLEEISEDEAIKHRDYLVLDTSPDYVTGRVGGRQIFGSVELFKGVSHKQHTAMMVMAMLGFYFEVARHDRDDHIVVHARHIRPDKLHHFEKIRSDATLALPYDYKSATHPSWQFWRRIGRTGISSVATFKDKDPDGSIMKALGQNSELLSELDIVKINSVYGVRCFKRISGVDEE